MDKQDEIIHNDEILLQKMGYKQELNRGFSSLMSFTFCFTAVSVIPSIAGLYSTAMGQGGPVVLVFAWIFGGLVTIIAAASLAEICSTYPSAGSVYHWAGSLADESDAPLYSYICGWVNLLGNAAGDAFFASAFASGLVGLFTLNDPNGATFTDTQVTLISMGACVLWASLNLMKIHYMGMVTNFSAIFQLGSTLLIVVGLFATCGSASTASTAKDMFFAYYASPDGPSSTVYVVILGTLTPLYSFTGYEAAGHMSEETIGAQKAAPLGIVYCALASVISGFLFVMGMNYGVASTVADYVSNGLAPENVFVTCAGSGLGTVFAVLLVVCTFFAGNSSLTVTSRISFAMARDGALPFSPFFAKIYHSTKAPVGGILLTLALDLVLLSLNFFSSTAFIAITSITIIGFQVSYAIPIWLRVRQGDNFYLSSFNLGKYGASIGRFTSVWLIFSSLLFFLPSQFPITATNFNYTSAVTFGFFLIGTINWFAGAKNTFKGPKRFCPKALVDRADTVFLE